MLLLTLRGTPTLYYGDEIGMQEASIPPEQQQDPWGIRVPGLGRDGCRTPMQWNDQPGAGFSPIEASLPWLPINANYRATNVEMQLRDHDSFLNLYRQLLALRKSSPTLQIGDFAEIDPGHEHCFAYRRIRSGSPEYIVLLNFSAEEISIKMDLSGKGSLELSTFLDRMEVVELAHLSLRKYEGVIVQIDSQEIPPG